MAAAVTAVTARWDLAVPVVPYLHQRPTELRKPGTVALSVVIKVARAMVRALAVVPMTANAAAARMVRG